MSLCQLDTLGKYGLYCILWYGLHFIVNVNLYTYVFFKFIIDQMCVYIDKLWQVGMPELISLFVELFHSIYIDM